MSIRTDRVAGEIQQALSTIVQRDLRDEPELQGALLTITKVQLSADLRNARIYVSILGAGKHDEVIAMLNREQPHLRHALAGLVRMKFVPELRFYLDDTQENVAHIENIFRKIREERQASGEGEESQASE